MTNNELDVGMDVLVNGAYEATVRYVDEEKGLVGVMTGVGPVAPSGLREVPLEDVESIGTDR